MSDEASVTLWLHAVRTGDTLAAEQLWKRYFARLMAQARSRMGNIDRCLYDEEDAALSTFDVLCRKLQDGSYPDLNSREDLWMLMLTVLSRKIAKQAKYQSALKRRSNVQFPDAINELPAVDSKELSQECYELISTLGNADLEQVVVLKFEGYTNEEIAVKMQRTRRTVQRMLNLIRDIWLEKNQIP